MKSSSGNPANSVFTTASAIAAAVTIGLWIASAPDLAAAIDVGKILKGVEDRYNRIQTLEVAFTETAAQQGRKHTESGELTLRKPGRMRWQYSNGKLYISDGKFIYAYYPDEKRAERYPFKEAADMRAPLAFLLGRLNFEEDFKQFVAQQKGADVLITATPKSDKMPYTEVSFLVAPDSEIKWLSVKSADGSVLEFSLTNEKKNPPVAESAFKFVPPPGVELVKSNQ